MRHWLIRVDSQSVAIEPKFVSFRLYTLRRPSLSIGDRVLFLEGEPAVFGHLATINEVSSDAGESPESTAAAPFFRKPTTYVLSNVERLDDPLSLDEARFSLTIVRNTLKPWVHFRRGYRVLPSIDFDSVVRRETFVARTGYFELLNSLPASLRLIFQSEQVLMSEPRSYLERLQRLHAFLDSRVFEAGRLLRSIEEAVRSLQLKSDNAEPVAHLFAAESDGSSAKDGQSDDLDAQLRRFGRLYELLDSHSRDMKQPPPDYIAAVIQELMDSDTNRSERRFERVFKELQ